jgi:hypothetical protein
VVFGGEPSADTDPVAQAQDALARLPTSATLKQVQRVALKLDRSRHGLRQRQDRDAQGVIDAWRKTAGPGPNEFGVGELFELHPGLPGGFIAYHAAENRSRSTKTLVRSVAASASKHRRRQQNLGAALLSSFDLKCRTLSDSDAIEQLGSAVAPELKDREHDDVEQLQCVAAEEGHERKTKPKSTGKPNCWEVGVCLCSPDGRRHYLMWQKLMACTKGQFPPSSPYRLTHLKDSRVFMLVRGQLVPDPEVFDDERLGTLAYSTSVHFHQHRAFACFAMTTSTRLPYP